MCCLNAGLKPFQIVVPSCRIDQAGKAGTERCRSQSEFVLFAADRFEILVSPAPEFISRQPGLTGKLHALCELTIGKQGLNTCGKFHTIESSFLSIAVMEAGAETSESRLPRYSFIPLEENNCAGHVDKMSGAHGLCG